ncbi:M24 family metallopeptidase [Scopulibacillus darangshiensis]|nr:M24 family metallopeptidase [Scopulibacillus darangshiensis]
MLRSLCPYLEFIASNQIQLAGNSEWHLATYSVLQQLAPGLLLANEYIVLQELLPAAKWVNAVPMLDNILAIKDDAEIKYLRHAARIADLGMEAAMNILEPGIKENEVAGEVERAIRYGGSEWSWSSTQGTEVGSGYRTEYKSGVTQPATEKPIDNKRSIGNHRNRCIRSTILLTN